MKKTFNSLLKSITNHYCDGRYETIEKMKNTRYKLFETSDFEKSIADNLIDMLLINSKNKS